MTPVIERGGMGANDAFARHMVGLRAGDAIDVMQAAVGAQECRVAEIQSRHLFAMRGALRDFASSFPDNPAFGSFAIDDAKGSDSSQPECRVGGECCA